MMWALQNTRLGNYMLGDTSMSPARPALPPVPSQGHAAASSNMVEYPPIPTADHTMRRSGPPMYEGVPTANLPTHQQINCMTCNQALRHSQRQALCYICTSYVHHRCMETLEIGHKYRADMCLICQQYSQRQLRVIVAIEFQKGRRWDPDNWFPVFLDHVNNNDGYGVTDNRDLNELEMKLATAIRQGLHHYTVADTPTTSGDGRTEAPRESVGVPTPTAAPKAPPPEGVPHTTWSSIPPVESVHSQRAEAEHPRTEGTNLNLLINALTEGGEKKRRTPDQLYLRPVFSRALGQQVSIPKEVI